MLLVCFIYPERGLLVLKIYIPCEQTRLFLGVPSLFLSSQVKHFK